ncbi:retrovirus-related pol polyprotein from transposon TNT 1-94 [Tanacetum coccineum]
MASPKASISKPSKKPKFTIIPPKQLFIDLTNEDTIIPSPKLHKSSPSAPNAPSKTPSTKDTSSSSIDYTLFIKKKDFSLIIVQIYVDDIIFGSTCQEICDDFAKSMHDEFEMSMMGELNFFLNKPRLESIRILLAYACALDFKLYQMDVKSVFLNGFINKKIYMA